MKKLILLSVFLLGLETLQAQPITWSEHIAPIIYNNCTRCHRQGEVAPFPLTSYTEVASRGQMIRYVTDIKYMPPWKADLSYQRYLGESTLTDDQIQKIATWVAEGMVQGNPALEPPLPVFPTGSQIGVPDKVVSFTQKYLHRGTNQDVYRYFVLPTQLTENKTLVSLEMRPGNNSIVHHALFWEDTTGSARASDLATPEYGFENLGSNILGALNNQLPGYVPGMRPIVYSHGIGQRLSRNGDLLVQIHYAPSATDQYDSSSVNLFFAAASSTPPRLVKSHVMVPFPFLGTIFPGPFIIPPNTVREFHGQYRLTEKVSLLNLTPHMHKLGNRWRVFAVTPTNDTVNLIKINDWDFNWQSTYSFKRPIVLPANTMIHAFATYDNTTANINNPNNPPRQVGWGEGTSDEMYYLPLSWVSYQTGDENLNFEEIITGKSTDDQGVKTKLYPISPNPAKNQIKIGFTLAHPSTLSLELTDLHGRTVKNWVLQKPYMAGLHAFEASLNGLSAGMYQVKLNTGKQVFTQKLAVE